MTPDYLWRHQFPVTSPETASEAADEFFDACDDLEPSSDDLETADLSIPVGPTDSADRVLCYDVIVLTGYSVMTS